MSGEVVDTFSHNEYKEVFGSVLTVLEKIKVEFCDFKSLSGVDSTKKQFLNLEFADFNDVSDADDLISLEKSFSEEDENIEVEYQDSSAMEDSGYKTNKQFNSHESHEFSTIFEAQTAMTYSQHGTKRKMNLKDEVSPRKKPKLWKFPSVASQIKTNTSKPRKYLNAESSNETSEEFVKIFLANIEKTIIKQEKAAMERIIIMSFSFAMQTLLSEEEQFLKCSKMIHFLIEKTFKLLSESPIRKPICREIGMYLIEQLCKSPVIYEKVIDRLSKKIEIIKNDYMPSFNSMYEQQFLIDLLGNAVSKFSRMDNVSVAKCFKEESHINYKQRC